MRRLNLFSLLVATLVVAWNPTPTFSQWLSDTTGDEMTNASTTTAYGLLISDEADTSNEVAGTSEHVGLRVDSRQQVDDLISVFAGLYQAVAETQTTIANGHFVNLNGIHAQTGVHRPSGNTSDIKDLRNLKSVVGVTTLASTIDSHYTANVTNSDHMWMLGGDFYVYPQSLEGGANVVEESSIEYAAGVSGTIYFDNNWGHINETLGGTIDEAFGGDFLVYMGDNYRGQDTVSGLATITSATAVRAVVEFADQETATHNGAMGDAYGVWAEINDTEDHITGKKHAIHAEVVDSGTDVDSYAVWAKGKVAVVRTLWKDWASIAACGQSAMPQEGAAYIANWHAYNNEVLRATATAKKVYFSVPYGPGTDITGIRVKWAGEAANDGVKFRLVERNETASATGWTVVGSQQTPAPTTSVTTTPYTLPSVKTMTEGYSYAIEVESVKVTTGVLLYAVGVQTSRREY